MQAPPTILGVVFDITILVRQNKIQKIMDLIRMV